ncbi:hypothetical protein EDD21DRAFT_298207 [Dissophora ornata]|nr:hypothetical protein EDD21DRAFT_298207 [Dissophora ornata]
MARDSSRRQRGHRKDLNGRTFPSPRTPHAPETGRHQTADLNKGALRTPAKFVHKVEEDRDLKDALTIGLTNSTYDCMICWDVVRPAQRIWNCQVCWAAFHLNCLSTWATKSSEESNNQGAGWRCPGCQNTQISVPKEYSCFCGKSNEPEFNRYFTPHSCGDLCGRSRDCPHPCNIPCHPGPCPPCGGLGPIQSCHCGSESFQLRCVDTDFTFQTGKSCNQVCGELLGCCKHSCTSTCHPGLCPPCEETEEQRCYCGKHERKAPCGDGEPRITIKDGGKFTGFYECKEICHRPLTCGHHECTKTCHPLNGEPGQCSARPEVVKTCPCGAKTIEVLLMGKHRTSCTDPIPVCESICKKTLNCGHRCMQKCHLGKCTPCKMTADVACRCGSTHVQRICSEIALYDSKRPTCGKLCQDLRACGKHQCTNRCCPAKGQSKGSRTDGAPHEAHACTLICGKKLRCGVHSCEMLCHKGHCNPCLNASFDELSCGCGRTVLFPPIACGTPIPKCKYSCNRESSCGHASFSSHPCHPDSEPCPPCTMQVAKQCMCRKTTMPNIPCYMAHPSCGKICGKGLDCGLHKCTKSCHTGVCMPSLGNVCSQPCPKARKNCGHRCVASCHGQDDCPEDTPCRVLVASSCKCGNLTKETACNASAENPWDGKPRVIKCNDYCLVAERNKRVALALNIDDSVARGPRIPRYDDYVLEYASINMEFTLKMEKRLADWVADSPSNTLNLPPMKGHHRKFVHELAAYYNVTSESMDVEPYRSVVIYKKLNTSVPDLLVSQACRQRRPIASSGPSVTVGVEQLRKSNVKDPVNAIYLHDLACGLTRNELSVQLAPIFGNIKYGIRWLTDDDAVLIPHPGNLSTNELDIVLVRLRTGIKALTSSGQLCERVELCWINKDGELVSHTSIGNGSQTKRFFNAAQANQLMKKTAPAKVENAFAILDDDERIAAAKKAEEERIMKAKEAAGTLSLEAWEENEVNSSSMDSISRKYRPPSVEDSDHSDTSSSSSSKSLSLSRSAATQKDLLNVDQHLVEDWQELLDDDNNDE